MANIPEKISPALARQLIRDGNSDRLNTDPHAVDALNQSVIEEFRANQPDLTFPQLPGIILETSGYILSSATDRFSSFNELKSG